MSDLFNAKIVATGPIAEGRAEVPTRTIRAAMATAVQYLLRQIKQAAPVGVTGALRGSIQETLQTVGDEVKGTIFSTLEYATIVELGSAPHWAPLGPLILWVQRKLSAGLRAEIQAQTGRSRVRKADQAEAVMATARKIQRKIAKHGTKGQHFFEDTFEAAVPIINEKIFAPLELELVRALEGHS